MPGTAQEPRAGVSWNWAGLGPAGRAQQEGATWAGAQVLRLLPGSGRGPMATQRAGFCAKRARSTDPTQAAVDHGGQQVASGVGIMADPGFTLAYLHLQLRLSWGAALCQAPPLCNHVFFALEVSWNFCEDSFKRGGDGASAVVVIIPGMVRKTSQQS